MVEAKHIVISAYMAYNDIKDINISEEKYWEDNHEDIEEYWTDNSYELPVLLEDWLGEELETDTYRYTTKLGEKIVAIAKYGYDN